jgi:anti-sigma factor RsiW
MTEPISEYDLMAYVDDQLDAQRRIEVEEHLSRHPQLAAQVMDDLCRRDELRLALTEMAAEAPFDRAILPVERLGRRLSLRIALHRSRRAIAASVLIGAGWLAHATFGGLGADPASAAHIPPVFAGEAVEAHRLALVEDADPSIKAATASTGVAGTVSIPMPHLPDRFAPVTSHVVPFNNGTAVQMLFHAKGGEPLTLFAAETDSFSIAPPSADEVDGVTVVYWQSGWYAYVLGGSRDRDDLLTLAGQIIR